MGIIKDAKSIAKRDPAARNAVAVSYTHLIRALASVIGEEDLSAEDRKYMDFGREFEEKFLSQSYEENRSITETLDLGWKLLAILGADQLDRIDPELIKKYGTV